MRSVPNDANYKPVQEWFNTHKDYIEKKYNYEVKIESDGVIKLQRITPEQSSKPKAGFH